MRKSYFLGTALLGALMLSMSLALHVYATEITNVKVDSTTENSAVVSWQTDINSDATINYGLDENFGVVRSPLFDSKLHSLTIENLDAATTYFFRVLSSDQSGNRASTAGFTFTTKSSDKAQAKKISKEIKKIKEPEALKEIVESVKEVANEVLKPPVVVGAPKVFAETDRATISWTTDHEANSMVHFAPAGEYSSGAADPYTRAQGEVDELVTKHSVEIIGLDPSTEYHFIVSSEDSLGLVGESEDDTFRTRSILPKVGGVKVSRIQETSATVSWSTGDVLAKGVVEYTNMRTKAKRSVGDPIYAKSHTVRLADLEFGTRYSALVTATNEGGDNAQSDPFTFITVRDVVSPEITKVNNESTLFPGEDTKIQTIISWETDEPALCQVFYLQGLVRSEGNQGDALLPETNPDIIHTQVIVGFAPATVYKFWMTCADEAGNESQSEDFVLITPIKEKSIIDIILENFEGTFGWVKNITN